MADLDPNLQASGPVNIVGGDEAYAADVVLDNGEKKLLVKSKNEISSDLRIIQEFDQNQALDDVNYFTIYSAGAATISGFMLEFDDKKVYVKLEIDGEVIFDINVEKFKDISNWDVAPAPQTYIAWNDNLKVFYFTPSFPIISESSIVISARSKLGQNKSYIGSIIQVG